MKILNNKEYEKLISEISEKPKSYTYYMENPHQAKKIEELENQNIKLEIELDKKIKEIERLKNILKKIDNLIENIYDEPLVEEDRFQYFYDKYWELRGDKE